MDQGMGAVAGHLARTANDKNGIEKDSFARSAFNRYYYSAFLEIRDVLKKLDPSWSKPNHADVPRLLLDATIKQIKKEANKSAKAGLLNHSHAQSLITRSNAAASELAALFDTAREVRRVADYEPEIPVKTAGNSYSLNECSLASAAAWKERVSTQSKTLLRAYRELGLISV